MQGLSNSAKVRPTEHFDKQCKAKGFTRAQVIRALKSPDKITDVRRYPGQKRYCGAGVAVVTKMERGVVVLVTIYLDGIVTPLREDQKHDIEALNSRRLARTS